MQGKKRVECFQPYRGELSPIWFMNAVVRTQAAILDAERCIEIYSPEGTQVVRGEDYIVRGEDDLPVRVSPEDFEEKYERLPRSEWTDVEPAEALSIFAVMFGAKRMTPEEEAYVNRLREEPL